MSTSNNITPLTPSDSAQRTKPTNGTNPDSLLLNMVDSTNTNTSAYVDQYQDMRSSYNYIDPIALQTFMVTQASQFNFSGSQYTDDQNNYTKTVAPIFTNLLYAIQNNDAQGVYNALSQALQAATDLKMKRANNGGYNDIINKTGAETNIYKNILNDPNMINLHNPQNAMEFFTQTMMWTNGGSLPDYMYNISQNVGATTQFMDPTAWFPNYNY